MDLPRPQRVLLYRMGSLGDHLVALPSYRLVRRAFPEAERRLMTTVPVADAAASAESILEPMGLVDGYITYQGGERGVWSLLKLAWKIRRWQPDVLVYLSGPLKRVGRDRVFFRLCGVRRQIALPLGEAAQNKALGERSGSVWFEQEGLRLARVLGELGGLGDAHVEERASWALDLVAGERSEAEQLLEPMGGGAFFGFSIGTKLQSNEWGLERWREFLQRIGASWPGYGLALVGAEDEFEASETIAAAWRRLPGTGPAVNLCGLARPRVSGAVLEHAAMFFGHDSGPAHMAAAVNTPVFAVFGARNPAGQWVPYGEHVQIVQHWVDCGGCLLDTCILQKKRCILSISVDEALDVAVRHMERMQVRRLVELDKKSVEEKVS
jgi:heptosyltransferase-3